MNSTKEINYKNYSKLSELKSLNKIDDQFVIYIQSLNQINFFIQRININVLLSKK